MTRGQQTTAERAVQRRGANRWRLNRQVSVSALVQIAVLASLIVGSWVNLQTRLDVLAQDVAELVAWQKQLQGRIERLWAQGVAHQYRIGALEQRSTEQDVGRRYDEQGSSQ